MNPQDDERPERPEERPERPEPRGDRPPRGRGVPCPKCGSRSKRTGPWPWSLGTVGAILCKAVVCNECGHEYDVKKPHADLATRKRNLAIAINGAGLLGIIAVVGLLVL